MEFLKPSIECHEYLGDVLIYKCATVCAQLPNCALRRQQREFNKEKEFIEDEKLGEMNLKKELKKYSLKKLTKSQWEKLKGTPNGGSMIRIYWKGGIVDYGYLFLLPECDEANGDYLVHIPQPDNSSGIGDAPPIWQHINNLLSNDLVKRISVIKN